MNPNVVVVLLNGGAISGSFYSKTPAVLEAFYPGALGGDAVGSALFGKVSPAGRLPYTIVQSEFDLPLDYYSMRMADSPGRTHRFFTKEPGFAFGFGLSYSHFQYSRVQAEWNDSGELVVEGYVANQGAVTSDEVVMCFVRGQPEADAPLQGLVAFTRLYSIAPGNEQHFKLVGSGRALAASNVRTRSDLVSVHVGSRAPGSIGAWADSSTAPDEPVEVRLSDDIII